MADDQIAKAKKTRRKWGDRKDGKRVKAPGLQTIMGYLWPKRTDCEVYLKDMIDATELVKYLERRNEEQNDPLSCCSHRHGAYGEGAPADEPVHSGPPSV